MELESNSAFRHTKYVDDIDDIFPRPQKSYSKIQLSYCNAFNECYLPKKAVIKMSIMAANCHEIR